MDEMTPTETAAKLRHFNAWRRDFDDKFEQPDPHEVSEAIDAAIEMIERMEWELRLIAETDPIDAALDPQRAIRIARAALEKSK